MSKEKQLPKHDASMHLRGRVPQWTRRLAALVDRSEMSSRTFLMVLALVVGLGGGYGAVFFRWLIRTFHKLFFEHGATLLAPLGPYYVIIVPAVGMVIVAAMVRYLAPETKGHGVPEVMEAVALRGGIIRPRVAVIKSLASAVCIGSGGSAGREGPIVQIGSALGSTLGQILHLSDNRVRTLVSCGAAAGIAATFNAPLAGVFFALEIIAGDFTAECFGGVVVSSIMASVVGRSAFGDMPAFTVFPYQLARHAELIFFVLLGIVACLVAQLFMRTLYYCEDLFEGMRLPWPATAVIGGLGIGVTGLLFHEVFGVGYAAIDEAAFARYSIGFALCLLAAKILATSVTLGSWGSGGIFAPSLFMGAMLGLAFGKLMNLIGSQTSPGAYALVGMGAVFAGTAHAPISAILILFELTRDYRLILPLMFACVISTILSRLLERDSIYTWKLTRRGVHVSFGRDIGLLNMIKVADAMTTDLTTVATTASVREVAQLLETTKHHGFPVVDEQGLLHGIVTLQDIRRALHDGQENVPVTEVATHAVLVCFPEENLNDALRKLGLRDVGRIPVVDPDDHRKILGLITRKNVITAYNQALMRQHVGLEQTLETETYD